MSAPEPRPKAPKTPLKRISRNSLRVQALSASQPSRSNPNLQPSTEPNSSPSTPDPLKVLSPLFTDLVEAVQDLTTNLTTLDKVCEDLDGFNQSFSSYLYGLRMSFYTTEFEEAPDEEALRNFMKTKSQIKEVEEKLKVEEEEKKRFMELDDRFQEVSGYEQADQSTTSGISNFSKPQQSTNHQSTSHQSTGSSGTSKAPKSFKTQSKAQQKQLMRSTEPIMKTLPIKFREQQPSRQEMEKVICLLFLNPNGLSLKQLVKLDPTLALHRARECATALVAAKQATKSNQDGLVYRLNQ